MENEKSVLIQRILFSYKNENGTEISCQSDIVATKEQALDYFFKAFEGADVSIIDVSNDKQWQQHSHEH
ncbi:hypothetical protein ACJ8LH_03150 [Serratia sp. CY49633]|uniref:hypothetical protein n=1 Tax=Serratia TaxID=613 RepID=UPI000F7EB814|nr:MULTISPECIES: hypothetical protein [Serratia]ELL0332139.1 hypothetical protein [Serratia marcescens]MBH2548697.1 hypothetical protein [Serratia marcescens]MBH2856972.1 hypothetical protein [Serratia marcescens]MBH2992805.1 hypothetical protein [Serratia marcescens]MBH3087841.1 hypothetical protein [Serratia marcescens]